MNKLEKLESLKSQGVISDIELFAELSENQIDDLIVCKNVLEESFGEKFIEAALENSNDIVVNKYNEMKVDFLRIKQDSSNLKKEINKILYPLQKLIS